MSDTITRLNQALSGRYWVERQVGEGGMATVYVAVDLRHERTVALKVLKPELAAVVGAGRFLGEIKTTAGLQHPHILPLFDSGEAAGFLFYVMPFVDGESLRQRLEREGRLPLDDAVPIAATVAEALDYAHRQGVIHRDIKPANILLPDGQPVLSDFGIALAVQQGGQRLTETGLSVGTPQYMSPEQATGEEAVGPPSDLYSLGCVLHEMLVGEPPFAGSSLRAVLARILTERPAAVRSLREDVPQHVDAAVARALEKEPGERFATGREMARALAGPTSLGAPPGTRERVRRAVGVGLGASAAALLLGLIWSAVDPGSGPVDISDAPFGPQRYIVQLPDSASYDAVGDLALTRDGETLVYTAAAGERTALYVRSLRALEAAPVSIETDARVYAPFFSPDGDWIGFFTTRVVQDQALMSLHKVPVSGGRPVTLAENARRPNGTWTDDGYIVYTGGEPGFAAHGLYRVRDAGGEPEQLTVAQIPADELSHHTPLALPGGRGIVFRIDRADSAAVTAVLSPETGLYHRIPGAERGMPVKYVSTGHLLVPDAGTLRAIPFDIDALAPVGEAFTVVDDLLTLESAETSYASFAVSEGGLLVYAPGAATEPTRPAVPQSLFWVHPDGREEPLPIPPDGYGFPRVSPTADRIATIVYSGVERADIWVLDAATGARLRLTNRGFNRLPAWTRDGRDIVFSSDMDTERPPDLGRNAWFGNIWRVAADGGSPPERLSSSQQNQAVTSVAPDGTVLYTALTERNARRELWGLSIDTGQMRAIFAEEANHGTGIVSPDGRWIAYASDETGAREIFVQAYPSGGRKAPISVGGGSWVTWSPAGDDIYYRRGSSMMAVAFDPATGEARAAPRILFTGAFSQPNTGRNYSVSRDGRFLVDGLTQVQLAELQEAGRSVTAANLVAIVNFFDRIRALRR